MKLGKKIIAVTLAAVISIGSSLGVAAASENTPKLYAVSNAHLDTVWEWDIRKTIKDYLPKTFNENFSKIEQYEGYNFNFEGVYRYALIKEYYPEAYEQIKEYVDEGRWFPIGSVWENGDVNVPSPESLMRSILYGNQYFLNDFGMESTDVFIPDCFGFGATLPTIINHMGLNSVSSGKLIWRDNNFLPFDMGLWKGIDGSDTITIMNPGRYLHDYEEVSTSDAQAELIKSYYNNLGPNDTARRMQYYGVGDTGGSPTTTSIQRLLTSLFNNGKPQSKVEVISAYSGQIADEMTAAEREQLRTYEGELQMKYHGTGSFTSSGISKLLNRKNELLADAAERAAVMSMWLGAAGYPQELINEAWKEVLNNHHHDNITGTGLQEVYTDAINEYFLALNKFASVYENSASGIIGAMDTQVDGIPVVVSNSVSTDRSDLVEATVTFDAAPKFIKVYDKDGNEVPSQILTRSGNDVKILFEASVKSNGYRVYNVVKSETPCSLDTGLSVTQRSLESNRYKISINSTGDIYSIFDKENNREMLSGPIELQRRTNVVDTPYGAWEIAYNDIMKAPTAVVKDNVKFSVVENGAARVVVKVERLEGTSRYVQYIKLGADSDRVDVENEIMWGETGSFLKVSFPLTAENETAAYDTGMGVIERGTNTEFSFEVPAQQWADLTDESGQYGVTIMNDSKYGWDKPDEKTLRLTLIHTPAGNRGSNPNSNVMDFGENRITYSIMGHRGDYKYGNSHYEAAALNQPMEAFQTGSHAGDLGSDLSFASLDKNNVMIEAMKKAEDSNEIIVRVGEQFGEDTEDVTLEIGNGIASFRAVNGAEKEVEDETAELVDGKLVFDIGRNAPKSFALTLNESTANVTKAEYEQISLDSLLNVDIVSANDNRLDGGLPQSQYTFPAELWTTNVNAGGIDFNLPEIAEGSFNAVMSSGQEVELPEGTTKLFILAALDSDDQTVQFEAGDQNPIVKAANVTEMIGGWDQFGISKYGGVKRTEVGKEFTHMHTAGGDQIYQKGYLFKYEIDIPEGVTSVNLPYNKSFIITALTAQTNKTNDADSISELYPSRQENIQYTVLTDEGVELGKFHEGNKTDVNYKGTIDGEVTWVSQYGDTFTGTNISFSMPAKTLILTPTVVPFTTPNLALNRPVTAVGNTFPNEEATKAVDGQIDNNSKWCAGGTEPLILTVDLGSAQSFNYFRLINAEAGGEAANYNTSDFQIQYSNDNTNWTTAYTKTGNTAGIVEGTFDGVNARYVRLYITKSTQTSEVCARIYEFAIYNK